MFQRPVMFGEEVAPCAGIGTKGDGGGGDGGGGCGCGEGPGGAGPTPGFVYATHDGLLAVYLREHVYVHADVGVLRWIGMSTANVSNGTAYHRVVHGLSAGCQQRAWHTVHRHRPLPSIPCSVDAAVCAGQGKEARIHVPVAEAEGLPHAVAAVLHRKAVACRVTGAVAYQHRMTHNRWPTPCLELCALYGVKHRPNIPWTGQQGNTAITHYCMNQTVCLFNKKQREWVSQCKTPAP